MNDRLEFNIDELVLRGFSPHNAHRIGEAIQLELGRLFQERGIPAILSDEGHLPQLNLPAIHLEQDAPPQFIGNQVAASIYAGFSPDNRPGDSKSVPGDWLPEHT